MTLTNVFGLYLEYLFNWNKSASLTSILDSIKSDSNCFEGRAEELVNICHCEWVDTQSITEDKVISPKEFMELLLIKMREDKIDFIIS